MAGLVHYAKDGVLTVNGVSLNGPAWDIPQLGALRSNYQTVGSNAAIAGVVGRRPKKRRLDEIEYQLAGFVIGHADRLGVAVVDAAAGMQTNVDYLITNCQNPVTVGGLRSVPASVTVFGQAARVADVQCEFVFGDIVGNATWSRSRRPFVLRLTVPAGRFI